MAPEGLFKRDPSVVGFPECEGPPLTDEMLTAAEVELGVTLPPAYVEVLRQCNGGYTDGLALPTSTPTSWASDHVPVDSLYGIPPVGDRGEYGTGRGILMTEYMTAEWGLPEQLVLLTGDGHWWIALDYRSVDSPSVVWVDVDHTQDVQLAESFETFVQNLVPAKKFDDDESTP